MFFILILYGVVKITKNGNKKAWKTWCY
jgi:hypothetical protein